MFRILFTTAGTLTLSWAIWTYSILCYIMIYINIMPCLRIINIVSCPKRATCFVDLILLLITYKTLDKEQNVWRSSLCSFLIPPVTSSLLVTSTLLSCFQTSPISTSLRISSPSHGSMSHNKEITDFYIWVFSFIHNWLNGAESFLRNCHQATRKIALLLWIRRFITLFTGARHWFKVLRQGMKTTDF